MKNLLKNLTTPQAILAGLFIVALAILFQSWKIAEAVEGLDYELRQLKSEISDLDNSQELNEIEASISNLETQINISCNN